MITENWNKVKTPPPSALKTIKAGRLKGMSDINPQWRYQVMTEVYGLCGVGWRFQVVRKWSEPGSEEQIFAFVDIELFINVAGEWSDAIPGHGGSMLVTKESKGLHSSDEAYKMATTDALSTAMKVIGVASDIYMGKWDGSKYKEEPKQPKEVTIGAKNVNWLIGFCKSHSLITPEDKTDFQKHYSFDPYKTTEKEFDFIKGKIEQDYSEA